jgi:predicted RNA binding protein YcfA (HicA-like mRNA interferase family)
VGAGGYPVLLERVNVREVIKVLERDGWRLDRQSGSHRQYRHPDRPGTVTVAGKLSDDTPRGALASVWRQAGIQGR